jgi:hypothetical protein
LTALPHGFFYGAVRFCFYKEQKLDVHALYVSTDEKPIPKILLKRKKEMKNNEKTF